MFEVNKPMLLAGAKNARELGGYPTKDGVFTKTGSFIRADGTHALTDNDLQLLREAGVTLVVDMRSTEEVTKLPSRFSASDGVRYENIAMFDGLQSALSLGQIPSGMSALYLDLLNNCTGQYARIFRLFIKNNGTSLFHCTAGKDRTGMVAMLLLQLAGVPEEIIIADYAASESNLSGIVFMQKKTLEEMGFDMPDFVFGSKPEDMEKVLEHLKVVYGGAAGYLTYCGLSDDEVDILRNKLLS